MLKNILSVLCGLVLPSVAVLGAIPMLGNSTRVFIGLPIIMWWVFAWLFLSSLCMAVSWYFIDARTDEKG
ncbi:DUF3311 domain-containing protein [Komagataeibacter xylinus]|uniref:DUF3311 domain-containing protein n=1 Tax=Komagataeibacter xylinus TaxID=28448 RepID=UPI00280AD698|nr:DUF3311 domain-containing protein [Komagataeibacter xylinus]